MTLRRGEPASLFLLVVLYVMKSKITITFALCMAFAMASTGQVVVNKPAVGMTICEFRNGGLGSSDLDLDGVENCDDNCLFDPNKNQKDKDKNGVGDACEWRKRADEEWERIGRDQRRTATEPADLERLAARSSNILVVRFVKGIRAPEDNFRLGGHYQVEIAKEIKGKARRIPVSVYRGIWVEVPDRAYRELFTDTELLVFLKNGKLRGWKETHTWTHTPDEKPYTETRYFGYELADLKYGVLGVTETRVKKLEEIVRRRR